MYISKSLNQKAGRKTTQVYLIYTLFKIVFFIASCIEVYNIILGSNRTFASLFERIASCNVFPFNLYPDIASVELVAGVLLLPFLLFYDDSMEGIAFSIRYKVMVIGLALGAWLVPLTLLESFYKNSSFVTGLGYVAIHLLLNAAAIVGLIFSPVLYAAGISSCFMIKGTCKGNDVKPENDPETNIIATGAIISIDDLRRAHCKRRGLTEKVDM